MLALSCLQMICRQKLKSCKVWRQIFMAAGAKFGCNIWDTRFGKIYALLRLSKAKVKDKKE